MLAVLLLSFVVMGFQAVTGEIIHFSSRANRENVAMQLVEDRLELVQMYPDYDGLAAAFAGTEADITDFPGLTRTTTVEDVADTLVSGIVTYKRVTVTVSGSGLDDAVSLSISLAAP